MGSKGGGTILHAAAFGISVTLATELIALGADVHVRNRRRDHPLTLLLSNIWDEQYGSRLDALLDGVQGSEVAAVMFSAGATANLYGDRVADMIMAQATRNGGVVVQLHLEP
jgi:hypothetical protein